MPRKKTPPLRKKVREERFASLKALPCFEEIHTKIVEGIAVTRIASYIQTQQGMLQDVPKDKLVALLQAYRKALSPAELLLRNLPEDVVEARDKLQSEVDEIQEMNHLYRLQVGRINLATQQETKLGVLIPGTIKEITAAQDLLMNKAKLRLALGIALDGEGEDNVEEVTEILIRKAKMRTDNPHVLRMLADPAARAKLLAVAKHIVPLASVATLEDGPTATAVIEAEGEEHALAMPIRTEAGKSRSFKTPEEIGNEAEQLLKTLSEEERVALSILLDDMKESRERGLAHEDTLYHALSATEYVREPVDIETFVRDDYFLGTTCDTLYPEYVKDLEDLFSGNYQECILTGAIGTGKTFVASIGVIRILYELSCMHNPQRTFGIATGSNISIVCMSVTESLAVRVAYDNIATKVAPSPYFQEHFPFERTKKELRFPNNIWVAARASNDSSALGLNVVASFLDETDFYKDSAAVRRDAKADTKASKLYTQLRRRMKSRFERHGRLPGIMFVVSSKNTNDDFTQKRIQAAQNDPTVFVRDRSLWEVKPEVYSKERFHVLCGNESTPSKILTPEEKARFDTEGTPEGIVIIDVPTDFLPDFESDLEGAIRDLAGISTVAVHPYIQQRERIVEAVDPKRVHPFTTESYDMGVGGSFLWGALVGMGRGGRSQPLLNPLAPRHIHIDTSLRKDATGFAMGHIAGYTDVQRRGQDGATYMERAPVFVVDLMLRIVPPSGREIILADVRHLVYELSERGFRITKITLDSHQSADTIQQLNARGYDASLLSVDVRPEPYDATKTALYEHRLSYYHYEPVLGELRKLEEHHTGRVRKIDHPRGGSKDVSDAVAGVVYSLQQLGAYEEPLPMLTSSRGSPLLLTGDPLVDAYGNGDDVPSGYGGGSQGDVLPPFLGGGGRFGFGGGSFGR